MAFARAINRFLFGVKLGGAAYLAHFGRKSALFTPPYLWYGSIHMLDFHPKLHSSTPLHNSADLA
jgi:hypothetical protein